MGHDVSLNDEESYANAKRRQTTRLSRRRGTPGQRHAQAHVPCSAMLVGSLSLLPLFHTSKQSPFPIDVTNLHAFLAYWRIESTRNSYFFQTIRPQKLGKRSSPATNERLIYDEDCGLSEYVCRSIALARIWRSELDVGVRSATNFYSCPDHTLAACLSCTFVFSFPSMSSMPNAITSCRIRT